VQRTTRTTGLFSQLSDTWRGNSTRMRRYR